MGKLNISFYQSSDVVGLAKQLLGKELHTKVDGKHTSGIIVETEAYHESEKACHAYLKKRTKRTELLFHQGGKAYIYLCYGIHHLFNVSTGPAEEAAAVLIRAILPNRGTEAMLERRSLAKPSYRLSAGPGIMSQALGITTNAYGQDLTGPYIWIAESSQNENQGDVQCGPRIGVDYAEEDARLPWRFYFKNNPWVSKPN